MFDPAAKRILIYRLGSIGDFVISLPCLHLIRERYPGARICLLTSKDPDNRAAAAESVLSGSGLIDEYIGYSLSTRGPSELWRVRRAIRAFAPDLLVYLAAPRGTLSIWRDYVFFRSCGIGRLLGFPFKPELQSIRRPHSENGLWEREGHRLGRCLARLGKIDFELVKNWDLRLTPAEMAEADVALHPLTSAAAPPMALLGLSIGTKQPVKDWGDENWRAVLRQVADPRLGLVLIGASAERSRSDEVARAWPGPALNLCGRTSPRVSAAAIRRTTLLFCNDSGPMHLAAAVGTSCVAVFGKHNLPGQWFPFGTNHHVFYPTAPEETIRSIRPEAVGKAAAAVLANCVEPLERRRTAEPQAYQ